MNGLDIAIMLAFPAAGAVTWLVSRRNSRRLSEADKAAADWAARRIRNYGPVSRAQVRQAAAAYARGNERHRTRQGQLLAHGLAAMADSMRDGDRVTGTVPWWKRL